MIARGLGILHKVLDISVKNKMRNPINLTELSPSGIKEFLGSFDHVFSDCDGVIWNGGIPMPGSGEFIKKIKEHGKSVHFVSNNSVRSREEYEKKFKANGIENGFENLTIPSTAIAGYLKSINFNKIVYCSACAETVNVIESQGFKCQEGPLVVSKDLFHNFDPFLVDNPDVGAVVFDSDFGINMPKLYLALTYLKRPEVLFINGATDRYILAGKGRQLLGPGPFTDLVVEETNRTPIQLGKPGKMFGEFAMRKAGVTDPSRVLFIGDMILQDIALGKNTGFKTLLVLTGHTKEDIDAETILKPDYYAPSLGSIVPFL